MRNTKYSPGWNFLFCKYHMLGQMASVSLDLFELGHMLPMRGIEENPWMHSCHLWKDKEVCGDVQHAEGCLEMHCSDSESSMVNHFTGQLSDWGEAGAAAV